MNFPKLTPLQLAALAGAVNPKDATAAKDAITDSTDQFVDFTFRIRGSVRKGKGEPAFEAEEPVSVELLTAGAMAELLRRLRVDKATLRRHLRAIAKRDDLAELHQQQDNADILAVFRAIADEASSKLPPRKVHKPGRRGAVRTDVNVDLVLNRPTTFAAA